MIRIPETRWTYAIEIGRSGTCWRIQAGPEHKWVWQAFWTPRRGWNVYDYRHQVTT